MTVADRALAWLKSQWIAPDVSVFLHEAIASVACGGCGAVVLGPAWCPACAKVIEESEAESPCVSASGDSVDVPIGVTSSPSPDFPPAAVERRDEAPQRRAIDMCTCGHARFLHFFGGNDGTCTDLRSSGSTGCECPRWTPVPQPAGKHLTIELPDKTVVDVSKLDGKK